MTYSSPKCLECKNYYSKDHDKISCKAFPEGIPEDILTDEFDHTKKHPKQDNDILFEPIEKK